MIPPHLAPPMLPSKPARTFVKRGFYMCCSVCSLAVAYCACDRQIADAPALDGSASTLSQRERDCKGKQ